MHRRPEPTQVAVLIAPLTFSRRNAVTPRDDGQGMINTQFGLVREGEYMRPTSICSWMSAAEAEKKATPLKSLHLNNMPNEDTKMNNGDDTSQKSDDEENDSSESSKSSDEDEENERFLCASHIREPYSYLL